MKKILFISLCVSFLITISSLVANGGEKDSKKDEKGKTEKQKVAIMPFETRNLKLNKYQDVIASGIASTFAKSKKLTLVEREQLDKVMSEMGLAQMGVISQDKAAEAAKKAGANLMVLGTFGDVGDKDIRIDARIIDVASGTVLENGTASITKSEKEISKAIDEIAHQLLKNTTGEIVKEKPIYKKWWFLSGVALIGGGTTVIIITQPEEPTEPVDNRLPSPPGGPTRP